MTSVLASCPLSCSIMNAFLRLYPPGGKSCRTQRGATPRGLGKARRKSSRTTLRYAPASCHESSGMNMRNVQLCLQACAGFHFLRHGGAFLGRGYYVCLRTLVRDIGHAAQPFFSYSNTSTVVSVAFPGVDVRPKNTLDSIAK